jgi:CubicO group peptidase (beta-lactamase class C family)
MFDTQNELNNALNLENPSAITNEAYGLTEPKSLPHSISGTIGDDTLLGRSQADQIFGKEGNDYLNGYAGNDNLFGGEGSDHLFGGSGDDLLDGGNGEDRLYGGSGKDRLLGGDGSDRLDGGSDRDILTGGQGDDILIDRDGGDRLTGGSGKDEFWIGNGSLGATEIKDFQVGSDQLKILDLNISYDRLQIQDTQKGAKIGYQGQDIAILCGIKANALNATQFDFGNAQLAQDLSATIQQVVQTSGTPGATASVTLPDGTTWLGAAGVSDLQNGTAMNGGDRFNIASITKGFTATLVLQLAQEGKLTLDDTLDKWLPDIAKSIPNGNQINLKELLNFTSGIPDYLNPGLLTDLAADPTLSTKSWPAEELLSRYVYGQPAAYAPGQGFNYSNTNYLLLGKIIEAATNSSLGQQFQSRIFEPLGMNNTFYLNPSQVPGGTSRGYVNANGDNKLDLNVDFDSTAANLLDIEGAAGGIISTATDIQRYTQSLFGGELLSPDSLKQMTTEGYPGSRIGFGIASTTLPNGELLVGAAGGGLGWSGYTGYLPNKDATVTVFTNSYDLSTDPEIQLLLGTLDTIAKDTPSISNAA